MITQIKLSIPSCTFVRDPQETRLGMQIMQASVELIDEIGLEAFTFRKLAARIESTEASVYRYFENKQQLLLFLYAWYWGWTSYRLTQSVQHVSTAEEKLRVAFELLINRTEDDPQTPFINEKTLQTIIEHEGIKSILTKNVDAVNHGGAFEAYKQLVETIASWIRELNPTFAYPNMLVTTIIEGAHLQRYFAEHLPRLTNQSAGKEALSDFFFSIINTVVLNKHGNH